MSHTSETATSVPASPAQHALDRIAGIAIAVAAAALLGLVVVQGWQVFTRYVLNDSPSWTEPVTLLLLATAMSLGAAARAAAPRGVDGLRPPGPLRRRHGPHGRAPAARAGAAHRRWA